MGKWIGRAGKPMGITAGHGAVGISSQSTSRSSSSSSSEQRATRRAGRDPVCTALGSTLGPARGGGVADGWRQDPWKWETCTVPLPQVPPKYQTGPPNPRHHQANGRWVPRLLPTHPPRHLHPPPPQHMDGTSLGPPPPWFPPTSIMDGWAPGTGCSMYVHPLLSHSDSVSVVQVRGILD